MYFPIEPIQHILNLYLYLYFKQTDLQLQHRLKAFIQLVKCENSMLVCFS